MAFELKNTHAGALAGDSTGTIALINMCACLQELLNHSHEDCKLLCVVYMLTKFTVSLCTIVVLELTGKALLQLQLGTD